MDKMILGIVLVVGLCFGVLFGGLYSYGMSRSNALADDIQNTILEKTSCEKMFNVKNNLRGIDIHFYDESKVIHQAERKWLAMDCDNPNSEYWRGSNWEWTDTIENKIRSFDEK